jgi:D-inositol-3-phosphate glycosyltransferase
MAGGCPERAVPVAGSQPRRCLIPVTPRLGRPRRVATISLHTSPLDQPGTGDAGGMNVYVVELAKRLVELGTEVDIFTRARRSDLPAVVEMFPGVLVRHVTAGPFEGLEKADLPAQLCAFTSGLLRVEALHEPGHYDLIHSHYWLSGQVGWLAKERWGAPLVHTMHTMAKVKNAYLAEGDAPEPTAREIGEAQVVAAADRLIASTAEESAQLVELYGADPERVATVAPGVDLDRFRPGSRPAARARLGLPPDEHIVLFVGRLQPLKAPDVLLHAVKELLATDGGLRGRLRVVIVGGPSGARPEPVAELAKLASGLGLADVVDFQPPVDHDQLADWYRAASVCVVPSYNESFGLVALEAQACGTPVVASAVGGLRTAVADGVSGLLVSGHRPHDYARAVHRLLSAPRLAGRLAAGAVEHAGRFSWAATAAGVLDVYRQALAGPPAAAVASL